MTLPSQAVFTAGTTLAAATASAYYATVNSAKTNDDVVKRVLDVATSVFSTAFFVRFGSNLLYGGLDNAFSVVAGSTATLTLLSAGLVVAVPLAVLAALSR